MNRETRVAQGGIFHAKKVDYSPETQRLLKELINESKLSMMQRKKVNESIKMGDPLPLPPKVPEPKIHNSSGYEDFRKIYLPRRRRKEQIELSGAYDREDTVTYLSPVDYAKEKQRLQDLMAFGKTIQKNSTKPPPKRNDEENEMEKKCEKIGWVLKEIEERENFLSEMKKLGQGKQYESIIRQEIAAKLRSLEDMDKDLKSVLKKDYNEMQEIKAATNTLFHG
ncbi:hypothetical protein GE061_003918 [Apolygus lucorum]|uniref:Uncharacterized protein n=1 Tax=Apolygus lucorum TaxID=248454 RepID=A0A8S9WXT0_APOLU|nr:hypothetical protein GE061_003918 [Apolygus lucorum]